MTTSITLQFHLLLPCCTHQSCCTHRGILHTACYPAYQQLPELPGGSCRKVVAGRASMLSKHAKQAVKVAAKVAMTWHTLTSYLDHVNQVIYCRVFLEQYVSIVTFVFLHSISRHYCVVAFNFQQPLLVAETLTPSIDSHAITESKLITAA